VIVAATTQVDQVHSSQLADSEINSLELSAMFHAAPTYQSKKLPKPTLYASVVCRTVEVEVQVQNGSRG